MALDEDEKEVEAAAREIAEYLVLNPDAADTIEGIVTWWVEKQRHVTGRSLVEAALRSLVEQGRVERQQLSNGTTIYKRKQ